MIRSIELTDEQICMVVCAELCGMIKTELDYKETGVHWNKDLVRAAALVVKHYLTEEEWEQFKDVIGMI